MELYSERSYCFFVGYRSLVYDKQECRKHCREHGFEVSESWVCRLWQTIDYTEKIVNFKQVLCFCSNCNRKTSTPRKIWSTICCLAVVFDRILSIFWSSATKVTSTPKVRTLVTHLIDLRRRRGRSLKGEVLTMVSTVSLTGSYSVTLVTTHYRFNCLGDLPFSCWPHFSLRP